MGLLDDLRAHLFENKPAPSEDQFVSASLGVPPPPADPWGIVSTEPDTPVQATAAPAADPWGVVSTEPDQPDVPVPAAAPFADQVVTAAPAPLGERIMGAVRPAYDAALTAVRPTYDAALAGASESAGQIGRILDATNQGIMEGVGPQDAGQSEGAQQLETLFRKAGVYPPAEGGGTILQNLNEPVIHPLVSLGDATARTLAGIFGGATRGAVQFGTEAVSPAFGRGVGGVLESALADLPSHTMQPRVGELPRAPEAVPEAAPVLPRAAGAAADPWAVVSTAPDAAPALALPASVEPPPTPPVAPTPEPPPIHQPTPPTPPVETPPVPVAGTPTAEPPPVETPPAPVPVAGTPTAEPPPVETPPVPVPGTPAVPPATPAPVAGTGDGTGTTAPTPAPVPGTGDGTGTPAPAPEPGASQAAGQVAPTPAPDGTNTPINSTPPAPVAAPRDANAETVTTATGRKVDTRFEVVPASSLIHATGDLQPRDRAGRLTSDDQIRDIAAKLDPALLHSSPGPDQGAPIVGPDHIIESGNGRVAAIKQVYAAGDHRAAAYRAMIESRGHSTAGITDPVLIRRRTSDMTDADRRAFAVEGSMPTAARFSATEQAAIDAHGLTHELLGKYDPALSGGPLAAGNQAFVRSWVDTLPQSERNAVQADDGGLSAEGVRRINGAMLGRAYGDKGTLARHLESTDDNTKNLTGALTDAAPAWAQLRAATEGGKVPKEFDTAAQLIHAADLVRQAREKGQSMADIVNQGDVFNPLDPTTEQYVRAFYNPAGTRPASRPAIADVLRRYAEEAQRQTGGRDMFAGNQPTQPVDTLRSIVGRRENTAEPTQTSMLGNGTKLEPPPAKPPAETAPRDLPAETEAVAAGWEAIGNQKMADSIRAGAKIGALTPDRVDFWRQRLTEGEAQAGGNAPKPQDRFSLDEFMRSPGGSVQPWQSFQNHASPEAKTTAAEVERRAQELTRQINDLGHTVENAHQGPPARLKQERSGLLGTFSRFVKQEVAVQRGFKNAKPAQRDATLAELRKLLTGQGTAAPAARVPVPMAAEDRPLQDAGTTTAPGGAGTAPVTTEPPRPPFGGRPERNFNEGTSPYRQVFRDAGKDPDLMVSRPLREQNKVIADHVRDTFGFKDVQIHPRQNLKEVRDQLSNFYQNAREMSHALAMPYGGIGLQGRVTLTTKPYWKEGQALGVYYPKDRVIAIPGRSNSYAHEWTHALDHYLSDVLGNNPKAMRMLSKTKGITEGKVNGVPYVPNSPAEAFASVLQAIYGGDAATAAEALRLEYEVRTAKTANAVITAQRRLEQIQSQFAKSAKSIRGSYWSSPVEMLARSNEAYVSDMIQRQGGDTSAIAKPYYDTPPGIKREGFEILYPQGGERDHVFSTYTELYDRLRSENILGTEATGARPDGADIMDPPQWGKVTDPGALAPGSMGARMRRTSQANKNWTQQFKDEIGLSEDAADPGYLKVGVRAADAVRVVTHAMRTRMEVYVERAPTASGRAALQQITDMIAPASQVRSSAAAAGRIIGPVQEQASRRAARASTARFEAALKDAGLDKKMSHLEQLMFRHVLTEGEDAKFIPPGESVPVPISNSIKVAAGKTRFLLDKENDRNVKAEIDLGYAPGFFPRQFNDFKIWSDRKGFEPAAAKVRRIQFEREVKGDPQNLVDAYDRMSDKVRAGLDPDVHGGIAALRANVKEQDNLRYQIENGTAKDPAAAQARLTQLEQEARDLMDQVHDPVRDVWAKDSAHQWWLNVATGHGADFNTHQGPNASYTHERVLPPETDTIMRDYLHTDPRQVIPRYFHQSARKIAYAERFGANSEKLEALFDQAAEGKVRREDIDAVRHIVEINSGKLPSSIPPEFERLLNFTHAMGTIGLMDRASFASLAEPVALLAKGGNLRETMSTFALQLGQIMKTANSKQRAEIAQMIGLTTSHFYDTLMADRANSSYRDAPMLSKIMTNFYRTIGLTQLTNSQRQALIGTGHHLFVRWANGFLGTNARIKRDAAAEFRNYGVADKDHEDFAKWLTSRDGRLPTLDELNTPGGQMWANAITSLIETTIQDPLKVDKPSLAHDPSARMAYGLMSFNYAFFRNIVEHAVLTEKARIGEAYTDARDAKASKIGAAARALPAAGRGLAHIGVAGAAIVAGAYLTTALRYYTTDWQAWEKHTEDGDLHDWLLAMAFQRSGFNGAMDPVIQAVTQLKYQRDLTGLYGGAQLGYIGQCATDMARYAFGDRGNTNTVAHNGIRGMVDCLGVPAAGVALSSLPGFAFIPKSAVRAAAGATLMEISNRRTAEAIGDAFVGPKGTKIGERPSRHPKRPARPTPGQKASQGSNLSGLAGLADDVAIPAARAAVPLWERLPIVGKVGIGALAVGAGVSALANSFTKYRKD